MKLKSAQCGKCRKSLSLASKFLNFKPIPWEIECGSCHTKIPADFDIKYTYYWYYSWKLCIILSTPFVAPQVFGSPSGSAWIMFPLGIIFVGGVLGIIASYILAFPLMFMMGIASVFTSKDDNEKSEEEKFKRFLDKD